MFRLIIFLILSKLCVELVDCRHSNLTTLIERVYNETNSATVYFVQFDKEFLTEFLKTHPQVPVSTISDFNVRGWKNITSPAVLVVEAKRDTRDDEILEAFIVKIKVRRFVIILAENLVILKQSFAFFTNHKFTRILGIADGISYAFLPYADEKVIKLSQLGFLPTPLKDLNGFTFRTIIQQDIPRTFAYTDNQGQLQVGGCFGQLFATFIRHHNATYKDISVSNFSKLNIPAVIKATIADKIDISFNAHPQLVLDCSYPVKVIEWVMMVPINGYVSPHEYFKRPFTPAAWICIGLALIYITLMQILLNKLTQKPLETWNCFSETMLAMLMLPSEKPTTLPQRLYLLVFVFSFIIGNIYVIFFTSFLTAFIPIKQFNSLEDLVENNFPILVSILDWKHLSRPNAYAREVLNLHVPVDHSTYFKELLSMKNTSYAYTLGRDRRDFLVNMQASLSKPLFRKAPQIIDFYMIGYILPFHSPFKDILNDFVVRVKETGLMLKWDDDVLRQAPLAGFKMNINQFEEEAAAAAAAEMHVPLTLRHLQFAWICAGVGWSLATLFFLAERCFDIL